MSSSFQTLESLLNGLEQHIDRIRSELPGWADGHLVPQLQTIRETAEQPDKLAAQEAELRQIMLNRAGLRVKGEDWLNDVLNATAPPGDDKAWGKYADRSKTVIRPGRVEN